MDESNMNYTKYIYSMNAESDDKTSMWKCDIEVRYDIEYIYNYI